jgi:hypothetical protein
MGNIPGRLSCGFQAAGSAFHSGGCSAAKIENQDSKEITWLLKTGLRK